MLNKKYKFRKNIVFLVIYFKFIEKPSLNSDKKFSRGKHG